MQTPSGPILTQWTGPVRWSSAGPAPVQVVRRDSLPVRLSNDGAAAPTSSAGACVSVRTSGTPAPPPLKLSPMSPRIAGAGVLPAHGDSKILQWSSPQRPGPPPQTPQTPQFAVRDEHANVPLLRKLVGRQVVTSQMSKQIGMEHRALFRAIAASSTVLQGRADRPGPQGAANALREAGKATEADLPSAAELAVAAARICGELSQQNLSNSLRLSCTLSPVRYNFKKTDALLVVLKSPEFQVQGTANTMQAPSCLRVDGGLVFAAPGSAAKVQVSSDLPNFVASLFASVEERREVSTAWTPATFRHMKEATMKMTGERLVAGVLEPQDLSNAVRNHAKDFVNFIVNLENPLVEFSEQNLTFFAFLLPEPIKPSSSARMAVGGIAQAVLLLADGQRLLPQDLSGLAWSLAAAVSGGAGCMAVIGAAARRQLAESKPQDLSNSLWTPGKLEICLPEPLTEDLGREARSKVQDAEPQNSAMTA
ncbi:hypothetical protein AK812_SmicGene22521 [Symbiodinium microadriaticum]|uniref:Uncharacterized protein n=1 Tax=Symbiodinium microadriaticum TaxID=2951 RepID=A0A1Q9DJM0_SYMMI|nr:hypothetical protein AK812_SmicGene22521 [Symbiodinium microadriaticum]